MNSTDNILISMLLGVVVVGRYSNYLTIVSLVNAVVMLFSDSLLASIGSYNVHATPPKKFFLFKQYFSIKPVFDNTVTAKDNAPAIRARMRPVNTVFAIVLLLSSSISWGDAITFAWLRSSLVATKMWDKEKITPTIAITKRSLDSTKI